MRRSMWLVAGALSGALLATTATAQDQPLRITYLQHSNAGNVFWQAVRLGMEEACGMIQADCQMIYLQTDGDLAEQLRNLEAAIASKPDGIITTLVNDDIFDATVQQALDAGIPVIGSNVDDTMGAEGNGRMAFIGQDLEQAGYDLAQALSEQFPADGPIHVLIGVSGPGQSWAEQRAAGIARFMDDYIAANAGRQVTYEKIDSGLDLAITGSRVSAYVQTRPDTTAYLDVGYWHAGAAAALRDMGLQPGQVLLAGFDLVPVVLEEMKVGWIQLTIDQQPYLQGFIPVMQIWALKKYLLSPYDVNTGKALVRPEDVDAIMALSAQGVR